MYQYIKQKHAMLISYPISWTTKEIKDQYYINNHYAICVMLIIHTPPSHPLLVVKTFSIWLSWNDMFLHQSLSSELGQIINIFVNLGKTSYCKLSFINFIRQEMILHEQVYRYNLNWSILISTHCIT